MSSKPTPAHLSAGYNPGASVCKHDPFGHLRYSFPLPDNQRQVDPIEGRIVIDFQADIVQSPVLQRIQVQAIECGNEILRGMLQAGAQVVTGVQRAGIGVEIAGRLSPGAGPGRRPPDNWRDKPAPDQGCWKNW